MRTIEKQVFTFEELSEEASQKVIENYRNNSHDDSFVFDDVKNNYTEFLEYIGFNNVKIYFTGFYSQGDGACFTGSYKYAKIDKKKLSGFCLSMNFMLETIKMLTDLQKPMFYSLTANISHRGHYYHENSMGYEIKDSRASCYYDTIDNDDFKYICKDIAKCIYKSLGQENDYINSDEYIIETIEVNEYEYYSDGTQF